MDELLSRALDGVDPMAPDAAWQIFRNLMSLVPWGALTAFTAACVVVGLALAQWRGSHRGQAVLWALLLGPVGWLITWHTPLPPRTCPRCGRRCPPRARRCPDCGKRLDAGRRPPAAR